MSKCGCCVPRSGHKEINIYKQANPEALSMKGVVSDTTELPETASDYDTYFVAEESTFYVAYQGEWLPTAPDEHEHGVWGVYDGGERTPEELADGGFYFSETSSHSSIETD